MGIPLVLMLVHEEQAALWPIPHLKLRGNPAFLMLIIVVGYSVQELTSSQAKFGNCVGMSHVEWSVPTNPGDYLLSCGMWSHAGMSSYLVTAISIHSPYHTGV